MERTSKQFRLTHISFPIAILLLLNLWFPTRADATRLPAPGRPNPFGVETTSLNLELLDKAAGIQAGWLRYPAFYWKDIEPVRIDPSDGPVYDWKSVKEDMLAQAAARGITVIATIKYTPVWAQKYPGYSCGPIAEQAFGEFASFLQAVVSRYSQPPYNIHYWEIGNEPDIDPYEVGWQAGVDWNFGCWGDRNDPYYGGGYYAQMLKQAYPAIKAADPQAQLLIGGLALDCDPTHPLPGEACLAGKFFEGILENGGAAYFDILSYHGYPIYLDGIRDEDQSKWTARRGATLGRADYLRQVMRQYGSISPSL